MLAIHPQITLLVVVLTPVSLLVAGFIAGRTYEMFHNQSQMQAKQTAFLDEMIGSQKTVQAFSHEEESMEQFDEINNRLEVVSMRAIFFSSITNPATRFINSLVYAAVALGGAFLVTGGSLTVGGLSAFLSYANQYTKPFNEISAVVTELQNALACAARIMICCPPMLILDEATSSIDTRTEGLIQQAFASLMKRRTSFIAAHRLSTIKEADIILVMKDGNVF